IFSFISSSNNKTLQSFTTRRSSDLRDIMIRAYKENDIDILIDIWYKSSLQAHDFIYSGYWESQIEEMKEKYIPMSETHVITNQTKIIGFISMVEGYLAALF